MLWANAPYRSISSAGVIDGGDARTAARLQSGGFSRQAADRRGNEDCFKVDGRLGLLLVADGMGGHPGGDVASRLAADVIVEYLADPPTGVDRWPFGFDDSRSIDANRLRTAIHAAHIRLLESSLSKPMLTGMGTTVVAAIAQQGTLSIAWVGDSRLYIGGSTRLRQLTRDDSWIEAAMAERPEVDVELLRRHPLRNALTNVLGANARLDVHMTDVLLDDGDIVVLTTDGVHGTLTERDLRHLVSRSLDPARTAADIVAAAVAAGSTDDCTAVIGRYA